MESRWLAHEGHDSSEGGARIMLKPSKYKDFNGKRYIISKIDNTKGFAEAHAERLRNQGYNARVVPFRTKIHGEKYTGTNFAIYKRMR